MCLVSLASFPQYMMKVDNDLAQQKEYLLRMQ
jgi:hypothetical protein